MSSKHAGGHHPDHASPKPAWAKAHTDNTDTPPLAEGARERFRNDVFSSPKLEEKMPPPSAVFLRAHITSPMKKNPV